MTDEADALRRELARRDETIAMLNQELERFGYAISHDFRAPIRAIDGFSRALQDGYGDALDEHGRHYLDRIRATTGRLTQYVEGLLALSRISRVELQTTTVDISALAQASVDRLRSQEPDRDVQVTISPGLVALADQALCQQLLDQLIGNAWKFTGKTAEPRIHVTAALDGEITRYVVQDNGAGFDLTYANKLFTPFQRLHGPAEFPGVGMGLAIAKRIVQRHGGAISVESAPGNGSAFSFTLDRSNLRF